MYMKCATNIRMHTYQCCNAGIQQLFRMKIYDNNDDKYGYISHVVSIVITYYILQWIVSSSSFWHSALHSNWIRIYELMILKSTMHDCAFVNDIIFTIHFGSFVVAVFDSFGTGNDIKFPK